MGSGADGNTEWLKDYMQFSEPSIIFSSTIGSTYYDYLEVCNPLGSKAKVHKLSKTGLRWMKYECKGLAGNPYKNGYVQHVCCTYGAMNAAHVQAALICRTCASYCHTSYMRNMYATCVRDMHCLHTCMLQVCCTCVSCMYAHYYSTVYMPLAHMQATSVPHM